MQLAFVSVWLNAAGVGMLFAAIYGSPPYGFFSAMKWVVVAGCALSAWILANMDKRLSVVSAALVVSALVQMFGKFRREEWVPWNWLSIVLLVAAGWLVLAWDEKEDTKSS